MFRNHCQARAIGNELRSGRSILRRFGLIGALCAVLVAVFAASALAVSGTPVKLAEPQEYGAPSVAVDAGGTAFIAWVNTKGLGGVENLVEYCVMRPGGTACAHTGKLSLAAGPGYVFGKVQVVVDGSTVLLLAGDLAVKGPDYAPTQEWQSTDEGEKWTQVLAGKSVAKPADDEQPVVLPGTGELGYGSENLESIGQAAFETFPLSPTLECSETSCPANEASIPLQTQIARESENGGQLGDFYASVASGSGAGVLGVYMVSSRETECRGEGFENQLAYVFGEGLQSASNSYEISPGKANSAWRTELTHSPNDCEVGEPAVAGGPSGFGVVENDTTRDYTVYHPFDQADHSFDTPYTTISTEEEEDPSLSQDGSGNIYLTYWNFEGVKLAVSTDGGANWTGPSYLTNGIALYGYPTSAVGADGQGWLVWTHEESVYAQQFVAGDATPVVSPPPPTPPPRGPPPPPPPPPPSLTVPKQTDDVSSKGGLSVALHCTGAPCTGTLDLLVKVKETTGKGKKKKTKIVVKTIGVASFSSLALGTDTVSLKLDSEGLKLLKNGGYKLKSTGSATYLSGTFKTATGEVDLKGHKPKKPKK